MPQAVAFQPTQKRVLRSDVAVSSAQNAMGQSAESTRGSTPSHQLASGCAGRLMELCEQEEQQACASTLDRRAGIWLVGVDDAHTAADAVSAVVREHRQAGKQVCAIPAMAVDADHLTVRRTVMPFLRQDPDVIAMPMDARNPYQLDAALTAAMTGHQIYCTVAHLSIPSTVKRLERFLGKTSSGRISLDDVFRGSHPPPSALLKSAQVAKMNDIG